MKGYITGFRSQYLLISGYALSHLFFSAPAFAVPSLLRDGETIAVGEREIEQQGFEISQANGVSTYRLNGADHVEGNYQIVDDEGGVVKPLAGVSVATITGSPNCGSSAEQLAVAPSSDLLSALGIEDSGAAPQEVPDTGTSSADTAANDSTFTDANVELESSAEAVEGQPTLPSAQRTSEGKKFISPISIPQNGTFPFDPRTTPMNPACGCRSGQELIQPSTCLARRSCTAKVVGAPELDPNFQVQRRFCVWKSDPNDSSKGSCKTETKTQYDPSYYQQIVVRCNRLSSPVTLITDGNPYSEGKCEANLSVSPQLWVLKDGACERFQTSEQCSGANTVNPEALVSGTSDARLYKDAFELKKLDAIQCVSVGNQAVPGYSFPSFEKSCSKAPTPTADGGWKYSCQPEPNRCEVVKTLPRVNTCGIYYAQETKTSSTKTPAELRRIGFMCSCQPVQNPGVNQIRKGVCDLNSTAVTPTR